MMVQMANTPLIKKHGMIQAWPKSGKFTQSYGPIETVAVNVIPNSQPTIEAAKILICD